MPAAASKETALKVKANLRNYWTSQTDTVNDFVNGNLDATYTWPDGYWKIKNHPKMKGRNIKYMQPVEGRLAWVCGLVLSAATERPGRSLLAMASTNTPQAGADLTDNFQYASAQKEGVAALIKDKSLIEAFTRMTVANYAKSFDSHRGETFTVEPASIARGSDRFVKSSMKTSSETIAFNYRTHQVGGAWKVTDVYLAGNISQMAQKRSDFASTLASGGAAGLTKRINALTDQILG